MKESKPEQAERYQFVEKTEVVQKVTEFIHEGGVIPICHPSAKAELQEAVDGLGPLGDLPEEKRERLGLVLKEMIECGEQTNELLFEESGRDLSMKPVNVKAGSKRGYGFTKSPWK